MDGATVWSRALRKLWDNPVCLDCSSKNNYLMEDMNMIRETKYGDLLSSGGDDSCC